MPRNTHLSLAFAHVGMARAGPYIVEVEARACPLRQLQDDASIATAQAACHSSGLGSCDSSHRLLFE
jgi:hypothetical protein